MKCHLPKPPVPGGPMNVQWGRTVAAGMRRNRVIAGSGLRMKQTPEGVVLDVTSAVRRVVQEQKQVLPFDMRWYSYADENDPDKGEWQIYLPLGCATLTQDGVTWRYRTGSQNKSARDADGNVIPAWYHLDVPQSSSNAVVTEENDRIAKSYTIFLNMKPWPHMLVSGDDNAIEEYGRVEWQVAVGSINIVEYSDGETPTTRYATRTITQTNIANEWDVSKPFSVKYETTQTGEHSFDLKVWLVNQSVFLGRLEKIDAEDIDITGRDNVWVKIAHDTDEFEMSVEFDLEGTAARSDDDKTVYRIYTLEDNVVVTDDRDEVPDMGFYTSAPETPSTPGA